MDLGSVFCPSPRGGVRRATVEVVRFKFGLTGHFIVFIWIFHTIPSFARCWLIWMGWVKAFGRPWKLRRKVVTQSRCGMTKFNNRDLQIRLRQRLRVRVSQRVPGAHARLREALTSTRSVFKITSPSWRKLRDFQQISSPDYDFTAGAKVS